MDPKRTSSSTTPTMTQTAIRKLLADSIAATLEEAANIAQRLMDQVLKHNYVQGTNDHKRKFDDRRTSLIITQLLAYAATPTKNSRSSDQELQEQGASYCKQPSTSVSNCLPVEKKGELQKSVPKSKQGCPWESIHAQGQRTLPKTQT
ncbi:hypothetical protein Tco_0507472 [Tanacetum coccineum]